MNLSIRLCLRSVSQEFCLTLEHIFGLYDWLAIDGSSDVYSLGTPQILSTRFSSSRLSASIPQTRSNLIGFTNSRNIYLGKFLFRQMECDVH